MTTVRLPAARPDETRPLRWPDGADRPPERIVLGRYRLGPVIGRGGMATVFGGDDLRTGRSVAIKLLAPHLSGDPQSRRRLLAEAYAVRRLPHPHIVEVIDAGATPPTGNAEGAVVLVM